MAEQDLELTISVMNDQNSAVRFQRLTLEQKQQVIKTEIPIPPNFRYNLLHYAVLTNNMSLTKQLIELGVGVNIKDSEDATPIFYVEDIDMLMFLLEKGAKLDVKSDMSLSKKLFFRGNYSVLKYLLLECNVDATDLKRFLKVEHKTNKELYEHLEKNEYLDYY